MTDSIKVYKGFNSDWTCRNYQFKVGETYIHDGVAKLCNSGFHACEYPLDIFNFYPPTGQIAECELSGLDNKKESECSNRAGNKISIKLPLTIPMLISAAIEYTTSRCNPSYEKHSDGHQSASSATGYRSASSATGDNAIAASFGLESKSKADESGIIIVSWWDKSALLERKRLTVGYIGENNIQKNTWYSCDKLGNLIEVK